MRWSCAVMKWRLVIVGEDGVEFWYKNVGVGGGAYVCG